MYTHVYICACKHTKINFPNFFQTVTGASNCKQQALYFCDDNKTRRS